MPRPRRSWRAGGRLLFHLIVQGIAISSAPASKTLEWSITAPVFEPDLRAFPVVVIRLRNVSGKTNAIRLHTRAEAPLRPLSSGDASLTLQPGEEERLLQTFYVPPNAPGGRDLTVRVEADDGSAREVSLRVKSTPRFQVSAVGGSDRAVHPGEKAGYAMRITNTGNVPLHCAMRGETSPAARETTITPPAILIPPGESREARLEVVTPEVAGATMFATTTQISAQECEGEEANRFLYFMSEVFPEAAPADPAALFENLHGSISFGVGVAGGGQRQEGAILLQQFRLEGQITEETRLQLVESYTHPSSRGRNDLALSTLPSGFERNFFHLGLYHRRFDFELGEVTSAPIRLLSTRETGDGLRAVFRPEGREGLHLEAFAERNALTLRRTSVFGFAIGGTVRDGPLESWRLGTLSKRGDIVPAGTNWDALALETGWKLPVAIPLRAEVSVAGGGAGGGGDGFAWLAGLHYNRTHGGEPDDSPWKAGVEFASGDKDFPGAQNGRDDQRAYLSYRFSSTPNYLESYFNYNNSQYEVVPRIERTLEELESFLPDFLLTSESRLITAGLRWAPQPGTPGSWRFPAGSLDFQEARYFNKGNFFDQTNEHAASLTLQPKAPDSNWNLSFVTRGGLEYREIDTLAPNESSFLTLGSDLHRSAPAPSFLELIGGPATVNFDFSGRFTENFDGAREAVNRTGFSATTTFSWQAASWVARAGATTYAYESGGVSARFWGAFSRRLGRDWSAGIEAGYTHRGGSLFRDGEQSETAVLFNALHEFNLPVPWLARRAQAAGLVFDDANNNGRHDEGEPGLPGVIVKVGEEKALTGSDGRFTLPPASEGRYEVRITAPADSGYGQRAAEPVQEVALHRGDITRLAVGLTKAAACEGKINLELPPADDLVPEEATPDLSALEVIATGANGLVHHGIVRADGFFALYLDPGAYELRVDPASLGSGQSVVPANIPLTVGREPVRNLAFVLRAPGRQIRRTFIGKTP